MACFAARAVEDADVGGLKGGLGGLVGGGGDRRGGGEDSGEGEDSPGDAGEAVVQSRPPCLGDIVTRGAGGDNSSLARTSPGRADRGRGVMLGGFITNACSDDPALSDLRALWVFDFLGAPQLLFLRFAIGSWWLGRER